MSTTPPTTVPANPAANPYAATTTVAENDALSGSITQQVADESIVFPIPQGVGMNRGGVPIGDTGAFQDDPIDALLHGQTTVGNAMDFLQSLPTNELSAVQSELANAGYYGVLNSQATEPTWGILSTNDSTAFTKFLQDAAVQSKSGGSVPMLIAQKTQQFAQTQQSAMNKTPISDLGQNFDITHLDPNEAMSQVDTASLKVLGQTLPQDQRASMAQWLDENFTAKQTAADQGTIAQANTNAVAKAQASDLVDPNTGQALDFNAATALARQQLGIPYAWGGNGPQAGSAGFDCSGLTKYIYGQLGITLPRRSQEQWTQGGGVKSTSLADAAPGDLVFFVGGGDGGTMTQPGHVGIYIGNGMMIDAPTTGSNVRIDAVASFGGFVGTEHFPSVASQQTPPSPTANNTAEGATPAASTSLTNPDLASFMAALRQQESGSSAGDYTASNASGASGAYQFLQGTWDEWAKKAGLTQWVGKPASSAPPAVQDQVAATAMQSYYNQTGDWGKTAAMWYSGQPQLTTTPVPGGPTVAQYASSVVANMGAAGAGTNPGTTLSDQGGRDVVSTPNTFTNVTAEDSSTESADLEAEIRARNPALAQSTDFANAYDMLAKTLKTGITLGNS